VLISFNPKTLTTTAFDHNLLLTELDLFQECLEEKALRPLTIHPLLTAALLMELLFHEALGGL